MVGSHFLQVFGEGCEGGVGAPAEGLGGEEIGGEVVHKAVGRGAMVPGEVGLDRGVDARVGLAEVEEVGEETMFEDGHVVVRTDVVPVEFIVVAQQEEAVAAVMPLAQQGKTVGRYAAVHGVPSVHEVLRCGARAGIAQKGADERVGRDESALELLHKAVGSALAVGGKPQEAVHLLLTQQVAETGQALGHIVLHQHAAHIQNNGRRIRHIKH